jgi:hypothetical protein
MCTSCLNTASVKYGRDQKKTLLVKEDHDVTREHHHLTGERLARVVAKKDLYKSARF